MRLTVGLVALLLVACTEKAPQEAADCSHPVSKETLWLGGVDFGRDSIRAVERKKDENGQETVRIRLSADAARRFGDLTGMSIDKPLEIRIGDEVVASPVVRAPITGGEAVITGGDAAEADAWAAKLKPQCPSAG